MPERVKPGPNVRITHAEAPRKRTLAAPTDGYLSQLGAMINESTLVHTQRKQVQEIQNSKSVHTAGGPFSSQTIQLTRDCLLQPGINQNGAAQQGQGEKGGPAMQMKASITAPSTGLPAGVLRAPVQRAIYIKNRDRSYSMQTGDLDELLEELSTDQFGIRADIEQGLKKGGYSLDQVLARFDFRNSRFESMRALITAARKELESYAEPGHLEKLRELIPDNYHPLKSDSGTVESPFLELLKKKDPLGNIRNLILEDTAAARAVMKEYRERREQGGSDEVLFKSILATIELTNSGALHSGDFTDAENELLSYATAPYSDNKRLIAAYQLDHYEHDSIIAYSFPKKSEIWVDGKWNPYYMGYSPNNWGPYEDGWKALHSALRKLPSLGTLGLRVTTFRASRESGESEALDKLVPGKPGQGILHGKQIMNQGQQHYISTALTSNVHNTPTRVDTAKGMLAITGTSGVLINPFGGQGFLDGAEILFPPGITTKYTKKAEGGYTTPKVRQPVYHLDEVRPLDVAFDQVDDFRFAPVKDLITEHQEREAGQQKALVDEIKKLLGYLKQPAPGHFNLTTQQLTQMRNNLFQDLERRELIGLQKEMGGLTKLLGEDTVKDVAGKPRKMRLEEIAEVVNQCKALVQEKDDIVKAIKSDKSSAAVSLTSIALFGSKAARIEDLSVKVLRELHDEITKKQPKIES